MPPRKTPARPARKPPAPKTTAAKAAPASRPSLADRTPILEWIASGLGLVLTVGLIGYTAWEGLTDDPGPPRLTIAAHAAQPTAGGFVLPLTVRNASDATASQVEIRGVLSDATGVVEERGVVFAYVPGGGETDGGLIFQHDPRALRLELTPEGYEEP